MAGGLHGSGLVVVDVAHLGADDPLVGAQSGGDHRHVGLGAADQKVDVGPGGLAQIADQLGGTGAVPVRAVAGALLAVGLHQLFQYLGVGAGGIVTFKADHRDGLQFVF